VDTAALVAALERKPEAWRDFMRRFELGLGFTRRFRAVHPKTPVLMVSGSLPLIQHRADDPDRFEFLAKPFRLNELLDKVRTLLDAAAPLPIRRPWCADCLEKKPGHRAFCMICQGVPHWPDACALDSMPGSA